jgi:hypothetical protein
MAITAITPASGTPIEAGDTAAFTIDDTYTSLVIKVQTSTALVVAYSTALGGGQAGYSVSVQDNGDGTHTVTYGADAGWDVHPQLIYVVEDETGSEATTNLSYDVIGESPYPQGSYPYNAISGPVVTSFNNRTGVVVPAAGDYDAFYYTEAESDALFAAYLPLAGGVMSGNITMAGAETVDGRDLSVDGTKLDGVEALADVTDTANVTAAGALMDSEVTNLSGIKTLTVPDSTTITTFIATLTDDTTAAAARTTLDAARAMLSGAGAPGVSTGDGYPLGTTYADTTADVGYILVDATGGANVWASGSGATYLSGAGAPGVSTGDGEAVGTTYIDTTADEAYFLCDNTGGANVWSTATGTGGGGGGDVVGPAGATDNRIARWDTTTGKLLQDSAIAVTDNGAVVCTGTENGIEMVERVTPPTNSAGYGKVWVDNTAPTSLMFTDDVSTDHPVVLAPTSVTDNRICTWDGTTGHYVQSTAVAVGDNGAITCTGTDNKIEMVERAAAPANSATYGKIWIKNDNPTTLWFTDDVSTDTQVALLSDITGGGGGNFTLANNVLVDSDKTEIVIGGAYIDGSTGGTYSWEILGTYNDNGGAGNQDIEIRLYDRGPDGTPVAGVLRSVLEVTSLDTLDRVSLTLTASASPGVDTDTIYNTARMYEVRAYLDATGGVDTAKILSVAFVEA